MQVLLLRHPDDARVPVLLPGIAALGVSVQIGGFGASPVASGGVALLDDGSPQALAAVAAHAAERAGSSTPVVALLPQASPERRGRLLAAGAARVIEGLETGERLAAELQALAESVGPDRRRNDLLQPFIAATIEAWSLMAGVQVRTQSIYRKTDYRMLGDISALIHLVGTSERLLVMTMGAAVARQLTIAMLRGRTNDPDDSLICDSTGEMVNIIAGQVKGAFIHTPYEFDIGIPTIITGTNHEVKHRSELPCFVMAFTSPIGPFTLQLCVRNRAEQPEREPG